MAGLSRGVRDVLAYVRKQRDALVANDPGARRADPDSVHDMRVAVRRLRSTLRTFRGLWNRDRSEALRAELSWLSHQLGPVRDGQVMRDRLLTAIRDEPPELIVGPVAERAGRTLADATDGALGVLRKALDSRRYARLRGELDVLAVATPATRRRTRWVRRRVRRALRRADTMLDRVDATSGAEPQRSDGRRTDDRHARDLDTGLHEARKAYKRARYAVEVLAGRAGRRARRLAARISALQDVLGAHQDSVITRGVLREQAARAQRAGENAFTYGLLFGRQQAAGERSLRRLPDITRKSRRAKVRGWLS